MTRPQSLYGGTPLQRAQRRRKWTVVRGAPQAAAGGVAGATDRELNTAGFKLPVSRGGGFKFKLAVHGQFWWC